MNSVSFRLGIAALPLLASPIALGQGAFVNTPLLVVPTFPREMRAAWVATIYQIDWPASRGAGSTFVTAQRTQMNAILNAMADAKMNCVFLQVRAQADAIYPSTLEPWAYYLTGREGRPTTGGYDPLSEWINGAHSRGIQLFAWVNPYRVDVSAPQFQPPPGSGWDDNATTSTASYVAPTSPYRTIPTAVKEYGGLWLLNPGDPQSPAHVKGVILDLVRRYDLDGVVFDDYFYPYPETGLDFPDDQSFALYGGGLSLANWRRKNVNDFVFDVSNALHNEPGKGHVLFGIGPFGIWKPGNPPGVTGLSAYDSIYADSKLWFNNGWVDFMSPQLYWSISSTGQPYGPLLNWWASQNLQGRHLWPSNNASQTLNGTWPVQEIVDQVSVTRNTPGATGNVLYSVKGIRDDTNGLRSALKASLYSVPALPPTSPWRDAVPPLRPNSFIAQSGGNLLLSWSQSGPEPSHWWTVQLLVGDVWQTRLLPGATTSLSIPRSSGLRALAIGAVDRLGNVSPRANRVLDPTVLTGHFRAD